MERKNLFEKRIFTTNYPIFGKILNLIWLKPWEKEALFVSYDMYFIHFFSRKLSMMLCKLCLIGIMFQHFAQNETQNQSTVNSCKTYSVDLQRKCWNLIIFENFVWVISLLSRYSFFIFCSFFVPLSLIYLIYMLRCTPISACGCISILAINQYISACTSFFILNQKSKISKIISLMWNVKKLITF